METIYRFEVFFTPCDVDDQQVLLGYRFTDYQGREHNSAAALIHIDVLDELCGTNLRLEAEELKPGQALVVEMQINEMRVQAMGS